MSITVSPFGILNGREAHLYTLENASGAYVTLSDFGARITSINVPDKNGTVANVCLGCDNVNDYNTADGCYLGATIGRYGNRIGGASFDLNGKHYTLFANDNGNTLHGGQTGFDRRFFSAECHEGAEADLVTFTYDSPDGEEGFPGSLHLEITFAWTDKNELGIVYNAVSDADTIINLTNHAYFNLGNTGDILDHTVCFNADLITEVNDCLIPTGRDIPVDGRPVDLRKGKVIRDGLNESAAFPLMALKRGYDFNFPIAGEGLRLFGTLSSTDTGRVMHVLSTEPAVQVYTGQHFNMDTGHGHTHYGPYAGIALETQHHPDAIHHPAFPSVILKKGEEFSSKTFYSFSVSK